MPFHFPLEVLLRLRATQTRQEEMRLESLSQQLVLARRRREELEQTRRAYELSMFRDLPRGVEAFELHLKLMGHRGLQEAERRTEQAIVELQRAWHEQEKRYLEARQREETVASLRQHQLAAYREDERRREQQAVDDLFITRLRQNKA
jgi:flagellar export protein FliJ